MLSKDEELINNALVEIIKTSKEKGVFPLVTAYDIEWLAEKLKEINDELSKVYLELQKANELSARLSEKYE